MFKILTHEQFHSGMSGGSNDSQWSDMRNIRSQGGKSVAVPRKVVILPFAGLHTVVASGKQTNYAFGSNRSVMFEGNDNINESLVWRVSAAHNTAEDDLPRGLQIRGMFNGSTATQFRVCYTDGNTYVEPVEETVPEQTIECYGCCSQESVDVTGTVRDENDDPLPGGEIQIFQFGAILFRIVPNGGGIWRVNIPQGMYTLRIISSGYPIYSIPWTVSIAEDRNDYLYPAGYGKAVQPGAKLVVWINPQFGPMSEAPSPIKINDVVLTPTFFDPPGSDPGYAEVVLDYATLQDIYAAQPVGVDSYEISVPLLEGGSNPDGYPGIQLFSNTLDLLLNDMSGASGTVTYTS